MSFLYLIGLAFVVLMSFLVGQGSGEAAKIATAIFFPGAIALYFSPSLIGLYRKHPQSTAIAILNLFLGWSIIGWVGALIWAYIKPSETAAPPTERNRQLGGEATRTCPYCAEQVKAEAIKCRHCQSDLTPAPATA